MKKPFTILTWLAPKSMAATAGSSDSSETGSKMEKQQEHLDTYSMRIKMDITLKVLMDWSLN